MFGCFGLFVCFFSCLVWVVGAFVLLIVCFVWWFVVLRDVAILDVDEVVWSNLLFGCFRLLFCGYFSFDFAIACDRLFVMCYFVCFGFVLGLVFCV